MDTPYRKIGEAIVQFIDNNSGDVFSPLGDKNVRKRKTKIYDIELLSSENLEKLLSKNSDKFWIFEWNAEENNDNLIYSVYINLNNCSIDYYLIDKNTNYEKLLLHRKYSSLDTINEFLKTAKISDLEFETEFKKEIKEPRNNQYESGAFYQ